MPDFIRSLLRFLRARAIALRQLPLFTNVDDLMTSWDRLETEAGSEAKSPKIQARLVNFFHNLIRSHRSTWPLGGVSAAAAVAVIVAGVVVTASHPPLEHCCRGIPGVTDVYGQGRVQNGSNVIFTPCCLYHESCRPRPGAVGVAVAPQSVDALAP